MSMISELVKKLRNEAQEVRLCSNECESAKLLDRAADTIEMLSVKVREPKWIPCSERLPEEEGEYLVTAKKYAFDSSYYDVQIAYCSPNKKWFRISNCEIVAWMPRPKPWKGADDEV